MPINHKCTISTSVNPDKVYLGTAEGDFEKLYHNHTKSIRNKRYTNYTSLFKHIWKIKEKHQVKKVPGYFNITKKCLLCFHKTLEIVTQALKNC